MNRKLRITLIVLTLLGTGVLVYRHFSAGSGDPIVKPEIVNAAAESSRTVQQHTPPIEDIPKPGRAAPASMSAPGG